MEPDWDELTKKDPNWKKNNWDKWTVWKKVRHVMAVICALILVACMGIVFLILTSLLPDPMGWIKEIIINIIRTQ